MHFTFNTADGHKETSAYASRKMR